MSNVTSLKQVCQAFQDFSQYLDLGLVLTAIRKLLSRLGCTRGTDRITSTKWSPDDVFSHLCIEVHSNDIVKSSNLFNRKISEAFRY